MPPSAPPHEEEAGRAGRRMGLWALSAAGWLAGVGWQLRQSELMPVPQAWLLGAGALCSLLVLVAWTAWPALSRGPTPGSGSGRLQRRARVAALATVTVLAAAALAFATTTWRADARLAQRLPAALEGRDIVVTGLVAQLPRHGPQGSRFLFEVEEAVLEGRRVALPALLSLGWYRSAEPDALLLGPSTDVRAGQRWRLTVRLRQPHGAFNPGGFDLELWLFERGVGATGSVRSRSGDVGQMLAVRAGAPVERLRQGVRDAIERHLPDPGQARVAGVIAALAIGDQAAIEREDWDLYRTTGVAHLMSISGLHVTMFAWLASLCIGWLWRRSERAMLWLPAPLAARWGGVALALVYALVAGWGVPAQRTMWMLAAVAALRSLGVRWPLHLVLLSVAVVVAMADPWALMQPGFWLSFVAVALLAASDPSWAGALPGDRAAPREHPRVRRAESTGAPPAPRVADEAARARHAWLARWASRVLDAARSALRTQAVATVGLAPLTLVFFQQISLVGFAANLVAIPAVTLLITPLALLGVIASPLWGLAAACIDALTALLQWLAAWPMAVWQASAAPPWAMAAGLLGGLVAVLPLPWRLRALALPLMLPLLVPPVARPAAGEFELVALDVGQGTAALVRTRGHLLVYDTGPAYSPESDAGSRLLVPLLRWRGERQVDHLVLSHRDIDHVGGAGSLLSALPVRTMSSSLAEAHPLVERARAAGATHRRCEAGQAWEWDGVRFEVLHPTPEDYAFEAQRPNAMSCVLRVSGHEGVPSSALLTGDIEAAQEAALAARNADILRARLVLVPHHGSRTSSTPGFIDAVAPELALAQAGYRSRFGHPVPDIVQRYTSRGVVVLRSDRCGAFTLHPGGGTRCERVEARRYWHHRADPASP